MGSRAARSARSCKNALPERNALYHTRALSGSPVSAKSWRNSSINVYSARNGNFPNPSVLYTGNNPFRTPKTIRTETYRLVNNVLTDLLGFLENEPEGKYLAAIEDETLPQVTDALLMMAQFDAALSAFKARYRRIVFGKPCRFPSINLILHGLL